MATKGSVIRHLRAAVVLQAAGMTDGQLLERFLAHRDEEAFEALVRRHGPMVWGVCRRALSQVQDAEDAFQATFLVLVRKAASIGRRELLGSWLYGTAYRVALQIKATRRPVVPLMDVPNPEPQAEADILGELRGLLDRELCRLPYKYRVAVVLCDLEGLTRKEAAQRLAIPEGTLSGRLTTARRLLAKRLSRYGLTLSGAALAESLSQAAASAAVPGALVHATVKAGLALATGQAAACGATAAIAVMEGVLKTMLLRRIQTVLVMVVVIAALAAAAGLLALPVLTADQDTTARPPSVAQVPGPGTTPDAPPETKEGTAPQNQAQGGIEAVVVAAWENGGEVFGWIHADDFGRMVHTEKRPAERSALPCFSVVDWPAGGITTLPRPGAAFGLVLGPAGFDGPNGPGKGPGPGDAAGPGGAGVGSGKGGNPRGGPGGTMPGLGGGLPGMGMPQPPAGLTLNRLAALQHLRILVVDYPGWQLNKAQMEELAAIQQLQVLHVPGAVLDEAVLKLLGDMPNLESLSLNGAGPQRQYDNISPPQANKLTLRGLTNLSKLVTLHLANTDIDDQQVKELTALKRLRILDVSNNAVTNVGLKELAQHKQWRALALQGTKITDAGMKDLAALDQLQALNLADTRVTDAGVKELAGLKQLRILHLDITDIGDEGLKALADLQQLRKLTLSRTWVTDAGLKSLASLRQLRFLRLSATAVTDAGVAALRKALPEVEVER